MGGDAHAVALVSIGGEVDGAEEVTALLVLPEEDHHVVVVVVHHQPLEALPAEINLPQGGFLLVEGVGLLEEAVDLLILLTVQQVPVQGLHVVPLGWARR